MTVDRQQFLLWVMREHGPRICETVRSILDRMPASDNPGNFSSALRQALIQTHPDDFEFHPATDTLPYGFCSD